MHEDFEIWCDNITEGKWLKELVSSLADSPVTVLKQNLDKSPPYIQHLLRYDRPDNIVAYRKKPILIIEKTVDTPSGHRAGQRFARFVNAAEEGVASVYFVPKTRWKEGDGGPRNIDARAVEALLKMMKIHEGVFLIVFWSVDNNYEVIRDSWAFDDLKSCVSVIIDSIRRGVPNSQIASLQVIQNLKQKMEEYVKNQPIHSSRRFKPISTDRLISYIKSKGYRHVPEIGFLLEKKNSLLYTAGTKATPIRSDPYAGYLTCLDYYYCRTGPSISERTMNICIEWPYAPYSIWTKKSDERINRGKRATKEIRICHHFSDLIMLKDSLVLGEMHSSKKYV